jgi:hypothetical protein
VKQLTSALMDGAKISRVPEPGGAHGTESKFKTSEVLIRRRDGVECPSGHDVGDGSAELVTDLQVGAFAFVLRPPICAPL